MKINFSKIALAGLFSAIIIAVPFSDTSAQSSQFCSGNPEGVHIYMNGQEVCAGTTYRINCMQSYKIEGDYLTGPHPEADGFRITIDDEFLYYAGWWRAHGEEGIWERSHGDNARGSFLRIRGTDECRDIAGVGGQTIPTQIIATPAKYEDSNRYFEDQDLTIDLLIERRPPEEDIPDPFDTDTVEGKIILTIPGGPQEGADFADVTLREYVSAIFTFAIIGLAIIAVLMILIGGYMYITATGSATRIESAKDIITNALMGLGFLVIAYILLVTIDPELVQLRFTDQRIEEEQEETTP